MHECQCPPQAAWPCLHVTSTQVEATAAALAATVQSPATKAEMHASPQAIAVEVDKHAKAKTVEHVGLNNTEGTTAGHAKVVRRSFDICHIADHVEVGDVASKAAATES